MSNDFYNASGWPITLSFGASVSGRSEMASIAAGFDKLAGLTGNASKFIRVNSGATAQEAVAASGTGSVVLTAGATLTGATISGSGAFTTLSASGAVTGAGFAAYLASPPAIGGTAKAAGTFTSLMADSIGCGGLVDISGAAAGQVKFPATQNPSANANTLDDYEEGTWTPAITFQTVGDLAVAYSVQGGTYTKIGRKVFVEFRISTSSFTFTTAAGLAQISGLPFVVGAGVSTYGAMIFGGITKAGYTQVAPGAVAGGSFLFVTASGSGVAVDNVSVSDMPSGGTVVLYGQIQYDV